MAKDLSKGDWHGVPRKSVPWFPSVDPDKCIGCEICYVTCGREVYETEPGRLHKAIVERPYNCMAGCSTCAMVCPTQAISFPVRDVIWNVEREHKIFGIVHKEAAAKREKTEILRAREAAEASLAGTRTRARVEIAGEFGDKQFLLKLENKIKDAPYDIVALKLEVPTVKGLHEKTPAFMSFELTSTEQGDVGAFLAEIKTLAKENSLVWVADAFI